MNSQNVSSIGLGSDLKNCETGNWGNDNNMDFKQEIFRSIQIIIDEKIGNYKVDRTFKSAVKHKNANGTYAILDEFAACCK